MEYTLGLAVFDYLPNIAFLVGAYFLVRISLLIRGRPCGRMMMAGTLLVFAGGFFKATWKMLYTTGVADLHLLGEMQFALLAPGFLAMLVAVVLLSRSDKKRHGGEVLAMAAWKIPLLAVMTISSLGAQGILAYICFRKNARIAASMFIISVICMLGMSGMASSVEQTVPMQWVEQSINSVGQIAFAFGSFLLYRAFLDEPHQC